MSSFFRCVPKWIIRIIETRKCFHCNKLAERNEIEAFGIRKITDSKMNTFYVEHRCAQCNKRTITSFGREKQASALDLAYEILEHEKNKTRVLHAKSLEKSRSSGEIETKEVEELLNFMNRTDCHIDFMRFIGASEIDEMPIGDDDDEG